MEVSAETSIAEEASLWLCNDAILLSIHVVVSKGWKRRVFSAIGSGLLCNIGEQSGLGCAVDVGSLGMVGG